MNWIEYGGIIFDVVVWYSCIRSFILDIFYLNNLKQRIYEKYPFVLDKDNNGQLFSRVDFENAAKNLELRTKLLKVKRMKVLLQFWRPYSYFYNDPEFPSKDEIMLLRMKK